MTSSPDPELESLRAATASPSVVQTTYTTEKLHTNILAAALNNKAKLAERRHLAAALWNLHAKETIEADRITALAAVNEQRLVKQGQYSIVDLFVTMTVDAQQRELAIEVKVDGVPKGEQLASLAAAPGGGVHRRMILLCLGSSQACRIEPFDGEIPEITRWSVADLVGLKNVIEAAAPKLGDAQAWLEELEHEELRRRRAWTDEAALADCGYRGRMMLAYRYHAGAEALKPSGSLWEVSIQPFSVVLHGKSSHHEVPYEDTVVTLYLEVADRKLRVKAGAWYKLVDARAATEHLIPKMEAAMAARGLAVTRSRRDGGASVSLISIGQKPVDESREAFVDLLRRVHEAWKSIVW